MRSFLWVLCLLGLLVGACGQSSTATPSTTTPPHESTIQTEPATTTSSSTSTTSSTTPTTIPDEPTWTVEAYGRNPTIALGSRGELGSGCSPSSFALPDGIWFGWIDDPGGAILAFDLSCLWPGRLEPAASNDSSRIRQLPVTPEAVVYRGEDSLPYGDWDGVRSPARNAPGLKAFMPYWLFVNEGHVTEIAEYPEPVTWARSTTAWPGLVPGCCDGGDEAPPSPDAALPEAGWPVDGFYKAFAQSDGSYADWPYGQSADSYEVEVSRWLSCDEYPELCPEWWTGDEVTGKPDDPGLTLSLKFNDQLTVVIMPIFDEPALVGNGEAFERLLADLNESVEAWIDPPGVDLIERSGNPDFPFGEVSWPGDPEYSELGYRGPGGAHLTWFGGWLSLEMRDGKPILYIHAGMVAG